MAKTKHTLTINADSIGKVSKKLKALAEETKEKELIITQAQLKDDYLHYSYNKIAGIGEGTVNVKGTGIVDDDLLDAFRSLNKHLACIDDVFNHNKVEFDDIQEVQNNELTALYHVTGFKVKGKGDDKSVVLIGAKAINCTGGRIALETPKIPVDKLSSYPWWEQLSYVIDNCVNEVELYMQGKCTHPEPEEAPSASQLNAFNSDDVDAEMENAKM